MKRCLSLCVLALSAVAVMASDPIQLSLTPDIAVYDRDTEIRGLSLNIWGENPQTGAALGFVNGSTGTSVGFQLGLLGNYADSYKGVMWGWILNRVSNNFTGWQAALVNLNGGTLTGLQSGFFNCADGVKGVQYGCVNYTTALKGVQLGIVNWAETCSAGVQIGLANVIQENPWFSDLPDGLATGMILVNWRF